MKKFNAGLQNSILSLSLECEAGMKLTACEKQDVSEIVDDRRCAEGTKQSLIAQAEKCEVKSELSATAQSIKSLAAFTLAEILLSLTVIGIVAAIALPSLLGNANERAWETQKKALYTRFSQSLPLLPSLNGYGETNIVNGHQVAASNSGEAFIRDGLSKVMKISNICDSEHLTDCGLPDKMIPMNGREAINIPDISTFYGFSPVFTRQLNYAYNSYETLYDVDNVAAAAFETVNGESVLVYYNQFCMFNDNSIDYVVNEGKVYIANKICANFVYDLNGKKGPNTVGKDIGFITAFYSTDPVVVAPNLLRPIDNTVYTVDEARAKARELDAKLPNVYEATSLALNSEKLLFSGEYPASIISTTEMFRNPSDGRMLQGFVNLHYPLVLFNYNPNTYGAFLKR